VHHAKRIMGVGQDQIQHIGVEIVPTGSTVMLRTGYIQVSRPPGHRVAQIVEQPMGRSKPMRLLSAPGTAASSVVPGPPDHLGRGKILDTPDTLGGIGHIVSRAIHDHISKKHFSRKYRPPPVPNVKKPSVTMLQSPLRAWFHIPLGGKIVRARPCTPAVSLPLACKARTSGEELSVQRLHTTSIPGISTAIGFLGGRWRRCSLLATWPEQRASPHLHLNWGGLVAFRAFSTDAW